MRVENVKGAVWTVDDNEYYKRRPQRVSTTQVPNAAELLAQAQYAQVQGQRRAATPDPPHHQVPVLVSAVS